MPMEHIGTVYNGGTPNIIYFSNIQALIQQ